MSAKNALSASICQKSDRMCISTHSHSQSASANMHSPTLPLERIVLHRPQPDYPTSVECHRERPRSHRPVEANKSVSKYGKTSCQPWRRWIGPESVLNSVKMHDGHDHEYETRQGWMPDRNGTLNASCKKFPLCTSAIILLSRDKGTAFPRICPAQQTARNLPSARP